MNVVQDRRGTAIIEFVLTFILFASLVFSLFILGIYGIGNIFVQEAAHTAAQEYAVTLDYYEAMNASKNILQKWAYPFVNVNTANIQIQRTDRDNVFAQVRAEPKLRKLYIFTVPDIVKTSRCVAEYRFRHPEEFN